MLKCVHAGTFHKISPQHLDRYVQEFVGRHNVRELDMVEQMRKLLAGMWGRQLTYPAWIYDYGKSSGANLTARPTDTRLKQSPVQVNFGREGQVCLVGERIRNIQEFQSRRASVLCSASQIRCKSCSSSRDSSYSGRSSNRKVVFRDSTNPSSEREFYCSEERRNVATVCAIAT